MSSRAYAYRYDRGPHDAISFINSEFSCRKRLFIAEYDLRGFFDNIRHEYFMTLVESSMFKITNLEAQIMKSFLDSPVLVPDHNGGFAPKPRKVGIPQGTSLSLFLANMAAHELDRELERLGVCFVRFADDTLIWSPSYEQICRAVESLHDCVDRMGVEINEIKSPGIRLLVPEASGGAEIASTSSVDFLGHTLGLKKVRIKESSIRKIKSRIEHLIYTNLLLEPLRQKQDKGRLSYPDVDKDYVTLIFQIRRYLYGSLSEEDLRRYRRGAVSRLKFDGVMSYFPLVDDKTQLNALDGWIVNVIWLALKKRSKLLSAEGMALPKPHGLSRSDLIEFKSRDASRYELDLCIPSFRRISEVIRDAVDTHGLNVITDKKTFYTYA
ncbi:hypothetical protein K1I36_00285 [Corynebacterium silvaticum]|nr:hypothetical protein [Corynebacterium silvaticum]UWH02368.1 hypothetical protein K1I38_00285 [Corynebacterium silvaticum]UWH04406.1 hypothetical protein K1I36_00285 [Corynebacterium silvaticum]UXZ26567.1 hypothetical protein K3929_00285 [Corynebacterium silvaticum]UXZ30648.1 hypothetical protein K3934_00285 [Corynebacterium silvaticum]